MNKFVCLSFIHSILRHNFSSASVKLAIMLSKAVAYAPKLNISVLFTEESVVLSVIIQ